MKEKHHNEKLFVTFDNSKENEKRNIEGNLFNSEKLGNVTSSVLYFQIISKI